jgi:hypothetical protein
MHEIEARNFTYCQAFYSNPFNVRGFLVMTPAKTQADRRAWTYALGHAGTWGEPTKILLYPRNYVKKARELYAAGLHD